jgi:hypothetical protein
MTAYFARLRRDLGVLWADAAPKAVRGAAGRIVRIGGMAVVAWAASAHLPGDPRLWVSAAPTAAEVFWRAVVDSPETAAALEQAVGTPVALTVAPTVAPPV